jgi:hypothetical protein
MAGTSNRTIMIPIFQGIVENGKLKLSSMDKFNSYLNTLKGGVLLTVKKEKSQRSIQQNKYYWGVVIKLLCEEIGLDEDELHEILKYKFLKEHVGNKVLGEVDFVRSTTNLTTKEMEEYLEKIRIWAAQFLNTNIPLPNEVEL